MLMQKPCRLLKEDDDRIMSDFQIRLNIRDEKTEVEPVGLHVD